MELKPIDQKKMIILIALSCLIRGALLQSTQPGITEAVHVVATQTFCGQDDCLNVTDSVTSTESVFDSTENKDASSPINSAKGSLSTNNISTKSVQASSTSPTTTPIPPQFDKPETDVNIEDRCTCDYVRGSCDINCCCDIDCSESDKKGFSHCIPEPKNAYSGLCYKQQFVYSNNTRYKVIQEEKGLFCISRDNFPERLFFTTQKTIHSMSSFNRAVKRKPQYSWYSKPGSEIEILDPKDPYKFGVPIWLYNNKTGTIKTLEIPASYGGTVLCKGSRTARYLENFESQCSRQFTPKECEDPHSMLNAQLFCNNFVLVASPTLINLTSLEESTDGALLTINPTVCYNSSEDCKEVNALTAPFYDKTANSCVNVMQTVDYTIFHNSSSGIVNAECRLTMGTFPVGKMLTQTHRVTFNWARNNTDGFRRSGFPGYSPGKPLVSGNLRSAAVDPTKVQNVNVSNLSNEWFSLPVAGSDGVCLGKTNILFKDNLRVQCSLQVSREALLTEEGCQSVRDLVWKTIFGDMKVNKSDPRQLQTLVSAFGDPMPQNPDDWVPIFLDRSYAEETLSTPCPSHVGGVQYRVLYSYFGPFSQPQTKIVGLFANLIRKNFECYAKGCKLKITTSVNFLDVSQQAVNKYAKAPMVKIRLPPDFFYPFSSDVMKKTADVITVAFAIFIPLALS